LNQRDEAEFLLPDPAANFVSPSALAIHAVVFGHPLPQSGENVAY